MTPRPFCSYKFYRRAPGRKLYKGGPGKGGNGAPAQECVGVGLNVLAYVADNAPSVYRIDANTLLIAVSVTVNGGCYSQIWKSADNGATWALKSNVVHPDGDFRKLYNAGIIQLGATFYRFFEDFVGGFDYVSWISSVDEGENWTGYDAAHRIAGISYSSGNTSFYVTPWDASGDRDHKALGLTTQFILVAGTRKTTPIVHFWKAQWTGTTWTAAYTSSAGTPPQPNRITALTDADNIYAGLSSENTSPWCYFGKLPKAQIDGGTITITPWAGPPIGAEGYNMVPTLWSEAGDAAVEMHQGIARKNTLNFSSRKTVDQAANWQADQTYPVLLCASKNLNFYARPAASPTFGALLDIVFAEYLNYWLWFERV